MNIRNRLYIIAGTVIVLLLVSVGSIQQWQAIPIIVIVITLAALIGAKWLDDKYYTLILYVLAITTLWQVSMLGTYVVGTDVHVELNAVKTAIAGTQSPFDGYNSLSSSALLMYIVPGLQKIGIPMVWQFKLLFPAIYAFMPVMLYCVFKRIVDVRYAFMAAMLLIIVPMFSVGMTSGARSMISQVSWVLALYAWFCINNKRAKYAIIIAAISFAVSVHYAFTGMVLLITAGATIIALGIYIVRRRLVLFPVVALSIVIVIMSLWYGVLGKGMMMEYYVEIGKNLYSVIHTTIMGDEPVTEVSLPVSESSLPDDNSVVDNVIVELTSTLIDKYEEYTNPQDITGTYLDKQPPLVRTALGLDFFQAGSWGKVFRLAQFATQGLIVLGLIMIIRIKRKSSDEITMATMMVAAMGMLLATLFVPYFGTLNSITRTYMFALYVLAPCLVICAYKLGEKHRTIMYSATVAVVIIYYLFTSGVVFELIRGETKQVNLPYSIALSNQRLDIAGVFTSGDLKAAQSVIDNEIIAIYTDYHGAVLLMGFGYKGVIIQVQDKGLADYALLTSININRGKMIYGTMPGLRWRQDIPSEWQEADYLVWYGDSGIKYLEE